MQNSLVSIVVPVYNGEKHIRNCIESLLNQTYKNIELIIINDGSRDNTGVVLRNIQTEDERIRIFDQDNKGVSNARNVGILNASGEYLLFLDSDDCLKENAIEELMKSIEFDTDIAIFGFSIIGNSDRKNDTSILNYLKYSNANKYKVLETVLSTKNNIYGYAWRALYSLKLLRTNDLQFPDGIKISEDYLFFVKSINFSRKISIIDKEFYQYQLGPSSMSTKYIPSLLHDMNYVNNWIYENIIMANPSYSNGYDCMVANTYLRFVQNSFRDTGRSFSKICLDIISKKREYGFSHSLAKTRNRYMGFDLKSYLGILLFGFHLDLLYFILFRIKVKMREKNSNSYI
ncbi:glycosyltransferase family 2 protein [Butyrivibrio sp. LC3010]|uniref:glycosyltransferase family 2 protein n=1 Tax=Butyrivibrio sp. LC3010 TaxID=1280680 RepID=UPI00040B89C1|nr:glycosyltransferase family 2 protein [Butyrivibrio sp. LC3010]